jgi:hypothetical protein
VAVSLIKFTKEESVICGLNFMATDVKTSEIHGSTSVQYGENIMNWKKILESMERFEGVQTSTDILIECDACSDLEAERSAHPGQPHKKLGPVMYRVHNSHKWLHDI